MDKISNLTFCSKVCLGIGLLAGICVMWALGNSGFLQALLLGLVVWAVVSALLLLVYCRSGHEALAEAKMPPEVQKQPETVAVAAVNSAPASKPAAAAKTAAKTAAPSAKAATPKTTAPKTAAPAATPTTKAPVASATAEAASTSAGTRPEALTAARGGKADDLKQIKGIGPKMETLCNSLGFYHFDQIAGWSADEVAWVDQNLKGFKGRVTRDTWVAQAKTLAAGGETDFSKRVEDGDVY